jgi:lipopolysaccharide assembly outer membrane protein LptD (OstA)
VLPSQFRDLGPVLFAGTVDDHLGEAGLWHLGDDFMPPRVETLILEVVVGVEEHGMNDECTMTNVEWQSARLRHFHAVTAQKSPHTPSADPSHTAQESSGKKEPTHLEARGHVRITLPQRLATADEAFYDVGKGLFTLKGSARISTPESALTSPLPMHYWEKKGIGEAQNGLFVHQTRQCALKAAQLDVRFSLSHDASSPQDAHSGSLSGQKADKINAQGNVLIATPHHTCRADSAVYCVKSGQIFLKGKVKAADPQNLLEGAYAILTLGAAEKITFYATDPERACTIAPLEEKRRVKALLIPNTLSSTVKDNSSQTKA